MTSKRRIEITIETRSLTIIRTNGSPLPVFCERCQKMVTAFAPKQIALSLQLSLTEICRRVETEEIHLTNTERGAALICGHSLEEKIIEIQRG